MDAKKAAAFGLPGVPRFQPDPRVPRTQLQFTWNALASSGPPPDRYTTSPRPIIIEKLKPAGGRRPSQDPNAGDGLDLGSSVEFSVVSQEQLNRAVQLAKRDIKRRHLEEQAQKHLSGSGEGPTRPPRAKASGHAPAASVAKPLPRHRGPLAHLGKTEAARAQAKVYLYSSPTQGKKSQPPLPDSPPTHDPGPGPVLLGKEEDRSTLEVRRLQKELQGYIQKVEELARKERGERAMDPHEERRVRIRRQEQAVRSNRMLYVLQQQVKEIQEDLDQLSPRKVKHTKKSQAMARLAAAHRGAVRALQTLVGHFARDQPPQLPPSSALHIRQVGHLLRQLSLCSARLETDSSVVPEVIVDLLLQIEDLDTLLAQQASPQPRPGRLFLPLCGSEPRKPTASRKLLPDELPGSAEISPLPEASGDGRLSCGARGPLPPSQAEAVVWQDGGEASRLGKVAVRPGLDCGPSRRKAAVLSFSTRPQGGGRTLRAKGSQPLAKQARFQEPTVSFRLKETKPPQQEARTPWVPPSLSSPQRRSEKGSKGKEPTLEKEEEAAGGGGGGGRQGALKKEAPRADGGGSPTQIADKIEQAVRERLEPLLAKVQKVNLSLERDVSPKEPSGDNRPPAQETEKATATAAPGVPEGGLDALAMGQPGEGLDPEALLALRRPLGLEAMLQRMEEMERFQQEVRRRYHRVVYSDTELGAQAIGKSEMNWGATVGVPGAPPPPPPIQMTRLVSQREPRVEIVLERPLDAEAMAEEDEEPPEPRGRMADPLSTRHPPPQKKGGTFLSVPPSILRGIGDYGARFGRHLRGLSHEPVGSFDPWHIAQSLAEELTEEALADVAAELHGLCEDYAEAVFTSEFLQAPPE